MYLDEHFKKCVLTHQKQNLKRRENSKGMPDIPKVISIRKPIHIVPMPYGIVTLLLIYFQLLQFFSILVCLKVYNNTVIIMSSKKGSTWWLLNPHSDLLGQAIQLDFFETTNKCLATVFHRATHQTYSFNSSSKDIASEPNQNQSFIPFSCIWVEFQK